MKLFGTILLALFMFAFTAFAGNVSVYDYTVTAGSTSSYSTLISSTPITVSQIYVCDTSGKISKIAVGAAASEVDLFTSPVSACAIIPVNPYLVAGSRLSIKSGGSVAITTGANSLSLLP